MKDTLKQFESTLGVVAAISEGSKQLAAALDGDAKIIVTTLQTFPFFLDKIGKDCASVATSACCGSVPAR